MRPLLIGSILLGAVMLSALAEEVKLRDGSVMKGKITKKSDDGVTIEVDGIALDIGADQIDSIDGKPFGPPKPAPETKPIEKPEQSPGKGTAKDVTAKVKHPVYPPSYNESHIATLQQRVEKVMSLSDEQIIELIPDKGGFYFCGCPNCEAGGQEHEVEWSIEAPKQVKCRYCGMVYPNEKYPCAGEMSVKAPDGKKHVYRYHQDANGQKYYFESRIWYDAREYFEQQCYDLAVLCHLTKDKKHAHKAALILAQFGKVYPGWAVRFDYPFRDKKLFPADTMPPVKGISEYRASKRTWWAYMDIPRDLIFAYDLIHDSGEIEKLKSKYKTDVRKMIEEDYFLHSVDFATRNNEVYSNMSPGMYASMIVAGRVLGRPELVHDAILRAKTLVQTQFFYDGFWCEGTPSYHRQTTGALSIVFRYAQGHTDPPGFKSGIDGLRFESLDAAKDLPFYQAAIDVQERFVFPDGRCITTNDAWWFNQGRKPEKSEPMLFGGMGYAVLGRGEGEDQFQAHLNWSGGYGHTHLDNLNILIFAKGKELIPDIGYTHTKMRGWTVCTAGHNTVMVDCRDQEHGRNKPGEDADGDLIAFLAKDPGIQIVEARATKSYREIVTEYRRMIAAVEASPRDNYVIDIFEIEGGSTHDWLWHGSADEDVTAGTSPGPQPTEETLLPPGESLTPPAFESDWSWKDKSLGFIENLRAADVKDKIRIDLRCKEGDTGVLSYVLPDAKSKLFLGQASSVRRAAKGRSLGTEDESQLGQYLMPVISVRRKGKNLKSIYVAVHEPYKGKPAIDSVERVPMGKDGMVVAISRSGATDYFFYSSDPEKRHSAKIDDLPLSFCGRYGFVSMKNQRVTSMFLGDGAELSFAGESLKSEGRYEGKVLDCRRGEGGRNGAFVVDAKLPTGDKLAGRVLLIRHGDGSTHGLHITKVEAEGGKSIVHIVEDAPFYYDAKTKTTKFVYFPLREIKGGNTFEIALTESRKF